MQPARTGLLGAYVALTATGAIMLLPVLAPFPESSANTVLICIASLVSGAVLLVPYAIDRYLSNGLQPFAASLVFPTAYVAKEYFLSLGPFGSWGAAGYSQYGALPLLQLLAVTGLSGIAFLMSWFASVCALIRQEGLGPRRVRSTAALCAGLIVVVIVAGGARMALFPPSSATVRVAALTSRPVDGESRAGATIPEFDAAASARMRRGGATIRDKEIFRRWSATVRSDLLARTDMEMRAGAKIVLWGEGNAQLVREDETAFIRQAADLASSRGAYLGIGLVVWELGSRWPMENKFVMVQPDGKVWEYLKSFPVPVLELPFMAQGEGRLPRIDTAFGRFSAMICADADYPRLAAQAGAMRVDLLFVPANDWSAIDPWHTQMASFRAIEQGFSLVRPTSRGLSAAFDYQGRPLSATDYFHTTSYAAVADMPTKGVATIYSLLGDWFAWTNIVGLAALFLLRGR